MTGDEALREAMKHESARIYGHLCRESTPVCKPVEDAKVIPLVRKRKEAS